MQSDMKRRISDTFLAMAKRKNVDRITVTALIEECGISRQTFYYHFQDLMDVIDWSVKENIRQMVQCSLKEENPENAMRLFVSATEENFLVIQKLLNSRKHQEIEEIIVQSLRVYLSELLRRKAPETALDYSDLEAALDFYSCGIAGLLLKACAKETVNQEKLARQMYLLLIGKMIKMEP